MFPAAARVPITPSATWRMINQLSTSPITAVSQSAKMKDFEHTFHIRSPLLWLPVAKGKDFWTITCGCNVIFATFPMFSVMACFIIKLTSSITQKYVNFVWLTSQICQMYARWFIIYYIICTLSLKIHSDLKLIALIDIFSTTYAATCTSQVILRHYLLYSNCSVLSCECMVRDWNTCIDFVWSALNRVHIVPGTWVTNKFPC